MSLLSLNAHSNKMRVASKSELSSQVLSKTGVEP